MSDNLYYVSDYQYFKFNNFKLFLQMEIQKRKPIPATSEDALEVSNMLYQMKRSIQSAHDSREWKLVDDNNISQLISKIDDTVFQLVHYYFSYNYEPEGCQPAGD